MCMTGGDGVPESFEQIFCFWYVNNCLRCKLCAGICADHCTKFTCYHNRYHFIRISGFPKIRIVMLNSASLHCIFLPLFCSCLIQIVQETEQTVVQADEKLLQSMSKSIIDNNENKT